MKLSTAQIKLLDTIDKIKSTTMPIYWAKTDLTILKTIRRILMQYDPTMRGHNDEHEPKPVVVACSITGTNTTAPELIFAYVFNEDSHVCKACNYIDRCNTALSNIKKKQLINRRKTNG